MTTFLRPLTLILAAGLVLTALSPSFAQMPADAVLRDFEPSGEYQLSVGGQEVPKAKIYRSQRAATFLIRSAKLSTPVLLSPRNGTVEAVSLMSLALRDNGNVDVLADAAVTPLGGFSLDGEEVVFQVDGREVRLQPKPPLVGEHTPAVMNEHSPGYVQRAAAYEPDTATLGTLRAEGPVQVRVFFGSWCPFCSRYLPRLMKVNEELADSKIEFTYYGMPKPPFQDDPQAKRYRISGVPTGVVFVGDKEVGRIEGQAWTNPEATLLNILQGS